MIALGGAIGTGLFFGLAKSIPLTGPSIILSYLIGGIVMYIIMRALGEMVVNEPNSGAFSYYANKYVGGYLGFISGWYAWFEYTIVCMLEVTAVTIFLDLWIPFTPHWLIIAVILAIFFFINFFAAGIKGFLFSLVLVVFSFGGTQFVGIAAADADNPNKTVPRAINGVIFRIVIFYIGTIAVILCLYPWALLSTNISPFVDVFTKIGLSKAAQVMNIVAITAALSAFNSCLYSAARMLASLANQGNAPRKLGVVNKKNIPHNAVIFTSIIIALTVIINYIFPDKAIIYLIAIATTLDDMKLAVYLMPVWILLLSIFYLARKKIIKGINKK